MRVHVEMTEWFKRYTGGNRNFDLDVEDGATAVKAVVFTGVPEEEVGFITVNSSRVDTGFVLSEGDLLKVYPLIIGG